MSTLLNVLKENFVSSNLDQFICIRFPMISDFVPETRSSICHHRLSFLLVPVIPSIILLSIYVLSFHLISDIQNSLSQRTV